MKGFFLKGIFLLLLSVLCSSQSISEDFSYSKSSEKILQIISILRHGASTGTFEIYSGEWIPYQIKDFPPHSHEHLTGLGYAQCWSMGAQMKINYPDFFSDGMLRTEMDYELNVGARQKSIVCAQAYYEGLLLEVPYIAKYTSPIPKSAFETMGNCHKCSPKAKFPFHKSQLLSEGTMNSVPLMVTIHPSSFYDLDEKCEPIQTQLSKIKMENVPKEAVEYFQLKTDSMHRTLAEKINHHFIHELPNFGMGTDFVERILAMPGGTLKNKSAYLYEKRRDLEFMAVFSRSIYKDIYFKLLRNKHLGYFCHDNNYQVILLTLLESDDLEDSLPYYASRLILTIVEKEKTGERYVRMYKDNEEKAIRNCGKSCPIEKFKAIIRFMYESGGDLRKYCHVE